MAFTIESNDLAFNPNQSRWYTTDLAIIAAAFGGVGVKSGCAATAQGSPDMTVAIASGVIYADAAGTEVAVTSGNVTIGTADGTNPRMDLITASAAGVKTVTAGTAAAAPKPPDLPSGHIAIAQVYVPAADTTIASNQITDKRIVLARGLTVQESDGTPVSAGQMILKFPNGSVAQTGSTSEISGFGMTNPMVSGGDMIYATGAANWATSGQGASAAGDGGDNSATNMIDESDATSYSTYNSSPGGGYLLPEDDKVRIDLGSVRSVGSVRFLQNNAAGVYVTHIEFQYNTDTGSSPGSGNWVTIDADRTIVNGENLWTLAVAIAARHWRLRSLVSVGHGAAWLINTWELRAAGAETPARLGIGAAGTNQRSDGSFPTWSHPRVPTKAGVPTDSDVLTTAADGMMILDTTNHRIYFRDGGVWKYAALT